MTTSQCRDRLCSWRLRRTRWNAWTGASTPHAAPAKLAWTSSCPSAAIANILHVSQQTVLQKNVMSCVSACVGARRKRDGKKDQNKPHWEELEEKPHPHLCWVQGLVAVLVQRPWSNVWTLPCCWSPTHKQKERKKKETEKKGASLNLRTTKKNKKDGKGEKKTKTKKKATTKENTKERLRLSTHGR